MGKVTVLTAALSPAIAIALCVGSASAGTFEVASPLVLNGPMELTLPDQASNFAITGSITGTDAIFSDGFDGTVVWDVTVPGGIVFNTNAATLASVDVPPGEYVAFARLQVETGSDPNPGNNYRLDCDLGPSFDFAVYRVGEDPLVERYVTFQGAASFDSNTTVNLVCRDGNAHEDTALSGKMTVIRVGN